MSKATQAVNQERLDQIAGHIKWAAQQSPLVKALLQYSTGCFVYAPAAEKASTGQFDHEWLLSKAVLVPESHCEEAVTIPAGYVRIGALNDHGSFVVLGPDPVAEKQPARRYGGLDTSLSVVLPGGKTATMTQRVAGLGSKSECIVLEDEDAEVTGPGSNHE
jgi:hypothetical protein